MKKGYDSQYYDYFMPHRSMLCSFNELQDRGIYTINEYRKFLKEL